MSSLEYESRQSYQSSMTFPFGWTPMHCDFTKDSQKNQRIMRHSAFYTVLFVVLIRTVCGNATSAFACNTWNNSGAHVFQYIKYEYCHATYIGYYSNILELDPDRRLRARSLLKMALFSPGAMPMFRSCRTCPNLSEPRPKFPAESSRNLPQAYVRTLQRALRFLRSSNYFLMALKLCGPLEACSRFGISLPSEQQMKSLLIVVAHQAGSIFWSATWYSSGHASLALLRTVQLPYREISGAMTTTCRVTVSAAGVMRRDSNMSSVWRSVLSFHTYSLS